jgi:hypothetical protein
MTTTELLCRHFSRMGARVRIGKYDPPRPFEAEKIRIDIGRDNGGEFFDILCQDGVIPEILDVAPRRRHLVLMVRDGRSKNKFLLGHDERHWFASAVPGDSVRDVRTAIDSLRPTEVGRRRAIRQGEWFFVPMAFDFAADPLAFVHRNEPLSRGMGSKPHYCEEVVRHGGETVMVSSRHPVGVSVVVYERLLKTDPAAQRLDWRPMVRDAAVYARGKVRHPDHKTVELDVWHRVHLNRERFAAHARQIAFLD